MLYKIIFKNFKANFKNYILFFTCNIIAVAEIFAFCGINEGLLNEIADPTVMMSMKMDFMIAEYIMIAISVSLMIFAMKQYILLRLKDYSFFSVLGMRKKTSIFLIFMEYAMGCIVSVLLGLLVGNTILYALKVMLVKMGVGSFQMQGMYLEVYKSTCKLCFIVMALVFLVLFVWMDSKDLSALILKNDVVEKKPMSKKWLILVFVGVMVIVLAIYEYQSGGWGYMRSHIEFPVGMFLVLTFGGGIFLNWITKRRKFYLQHILKLNQLNSRYQSNILIMVILIFVHFFSLSYITVEIIDELPVNKDRNYYKYDVIWMAQEKDKLYSDAIAQKYNGYVESVPMIRVTTFWDTEHIGISESDYKLLTGKSYNLKDKEIVVSVEVQELATGDSVKNQMEDVYDWLLIGKYRLENNELMISDFRNSDKNKFVVKEIITSNVWGKYALDDYSENIVVFSDEYFSAQWEMISEKQDEPSKIYMFILPSSRRKDAFDELKTYIAENGIQPIQSPNAGTARHNTYYGTDEFLHSQKMNSLFVISSKLFIGVTLFFSGVFTMIIKVLSELEIYRKKYEFLNLMGMPKDELIKTLYSEMESLFSIALTASCILATIYVGTVANLRYQEGQSLGTDFWKYWIFAIGGYAIINGVIQRLFAAYIRKRIL